MMSQKLSKTTCALALFVSLPLFRWSEALEREFEPRVVIPPDRFPPITEVPVVAGKDAELDDSELVLGAVVSGKARAYPINMLTGPSREILNDQLGGVAIAATW